MCPSELFPSGIHSISASFPFSWAAAAAFLSCWYCRHHGCLLLLPGSKPALRSDYSQDGCKVLVSALLSSVLHTSAQLLQPSCLLSLPCIEATTSHEDEGEEEWGATMHAPLAEAPGGLHWPTLWRALLLCVHCPCRLTSAVISHHCALSWHTDNPSEQLQFHGGYIKNVTSTAITAAISSGCLPCRGTCVPTASTWAWKAGCCYCKWTLQFVSVRKLEKFMKEEKGWGTGRQKTHRLAGKGWIQEKRRWIGARFEG